MSNSKFGLSHYKKPTPAKMRNLGDALLAVSTMMTGYAIVEEMKIVGLISLGVGMAGKFMTNFWGKHE